MGALLFLAIIGCWLAFWTIVVIPFLVELGANRNPFARFFDDGKGE